MQTHHRIIFSDSRDLSILADESVDLLITSPPYPMIQMWDHLFSMLSTQARNALLHTDGTTAFEAMHQELDTVWCESYRILKKGAFACINIGDAVRTIGNQFQLYPNHSRIISIFQSLGFEVLPEILWRKPTNAPNKFMGSGMLPAGAYVTLEHEYILIFRKGGKRVFDQKQLKNIRNQSAFFWEERNNWFSDSWDLRGVKQATNDKAVRERNAAYPFELPYRLINMYSVKGDTVFDPFLGTGTSSFAAIASERNSIGIEFDSKCSTIIRQGLQEMKSNANRLITRRLEDHCSFCTNYQKKKGHIKYINVPFGFPVITKQETQLTLNHVSEIDMTDLAAIRVHYQPIVWSPSVIKQEV